MKFCYYFPFQFNVKYPTHGVRPKDLHLKTATGSATASSVPAQNLLHSAYYGNTSNCEIEQQSSQSQHHQQAATTVDLDINVHIIKNMLMTNRVPESCV